MTTNTHDETIQSEKLARILERKENLTRAIKSSEERIDEKIASLMAAGFISNEIDSEPLIQTRTASLINTKQNDIFSEIDLSDDDALDQAVRSSKPASRLAFSNDDPFDPFEAPISLADENDEVPTLSKVLGHSPDFDKAADNLSFDEILLQTKPIDITDGLTETKPDLEQIKPDLEQTIEPVLDKVEREKTSPKIKKDSKRASQEKAKPKRLYQAKTAPTGKDMILPSFLFILGIIACGVFLVGFSANFNFIDYSVLFILLTCMIFTIALPYGMSLFFMALITVSYGLLIIVSTLSFNLPFSGYQFAWLIIIPLILFGNILLIQRIRELYHFKKDLEAQISAYDVMDQSLGLTTEKTYYKDLKDAMDRASVNETTLAVEMISISHLPTLRAMNGPRIWDEILYKTLKIIKKHSYSTHLIYVLEGNVFSIIMENTSMKNQLMINQSIRNDFEALISDFDVIDVPVSLKVAAIPYSREISNPFDYRALGFKHLDH